MLAAVKLGVRFVALKSPDARHAFAETTKRGARPYLSPKEFTDDKGTVIMSGVHTYGDTVHLFVDRQNYNGTFMPGFMDFTKSEAGSVGLKHVDHIVGNVEKGCMNKWCKFYEDCFGMANLVTFDDKDVSTQFTALMSKVMTNQTGYVKFPINEPADGLRKSQIEEYIDFYRSAGVQHIAVATDDIVSTVTELQKRGCEFLRVPGSYYDSLQERVGKIDEDLNTIRKLGLLVDRDEYGYMLQIFTKPVLDRPTLFFEVIQRKGAMSFGKGNFKALFESVEEEQRKRNTLEK